MISKQLIRNRLRPQLARRQSVNKTRFFRVQPGGFAARQCNSRRLHHSLASY